VNRFAVGGFGFHCGRRKTRNHQPKTVQPQTWFPGNG
jgi:hypothetical protein